MLPQQRERRKLVILVIALGQRDLGLLGFLRLDDVELNFARGGRLGRFARRTDRGLGRRRFGCGRLRWQRSEGPLGRHGGELIAHGRNQFLCCARGRRRRGDHRGGFFGRGFTFHPQLLGAGHGLCGAFLAPLGEGVHQLSNVCHNIAAKDADESHQIDGAKDQGRSENPEAVFQQRQIEKRTEQAARATGEVYLAGENRLLHRHQGRKRNQTADDREKASGGETAGPPKVNEGHAQQKHRDQPGGAAQQVKDPPRVFGTDYADQVHTRGISGVLDALGRFKIKHRHCDQDAKDQTGEGGEPMRPVTGGFKG